MPQILRVHWVWPSKYKEKWCFSPKCVVFRNRSSYSLETCTIALAQNLRVHWVWPSKYKEKWCFSPKCGFFFRNGSLYSFETSSHLKTSECTKIGPLNTKKSDMLTQNVFFSKMDHHTALKLVPLWSSDLKTSECTEFGPLTIKESDFFAQNVFFSETDYHTALKVVPLWSSHHKTWECTDFGPLNTKKGDALAQNVLFFRSGLIIQLWNLYHCDHHTWKPQGKLSLVL